MGETMAHMHRHLAQFNHGLYGAANHDQMRKFHEEAACKLREHIAADKKACDEASSEREACRREHADRDRDHALKCLERPPRPTYGYGHHGYGSHGSHGYGYGRF